MHSEILTGGTVFQLSCEGMLFFITEIKRNYSVMNRTQIILMK